MLDECCFFLRLVRLVVLSLPWDTADPESFGG